MIRKNCSVSFRKTKSAIFKQHRLNSKRFICFLLFFGQLFFLLSGITSAGVIYAQNGFRVMFYNTENLFDCDHDSLKNDTEYLPSSMRAWHYGRYKQKINNIAKVIAAVGEWTPPVLVGLCEVENNRVMDDLVKYSSLKEFEYRYIMTNSRDERGIDVALLYQRGSFRLLHQESVRIFFQEKGRKPTRDILYASGLVSTGDTLDVFVIHFPSRAGGERESEPARKFVASVLKQKTDSLSLYRFHPNILIMGDFNDGHKSVAISKTLGAVSPNSLISDHSLYDLFIQSGDKISHGTYKYQGEWETIDHIIVSGYLLQKKEGFFVKGSMAHVPSLSFLMEKDEKYTGYCPFRTYVGMKYHGGFSDHLPIFVDFSLPE